MLWLVSWILQEKVFRFVGLVMAVLGVVFVGREHHHCFAKCGVAAITFQLVSLLLLSTVNSFYAWYAHLKHVVYQWRPVYMIQLARLIGKQLLQLNPSLNIGEIEELLIADHALWLQSYQSHSMTDKHKLLRLHRTLSDLIVRYELPKMLFRKLNCFGRLVISDELHH